MLNDDFRFNYESIRSMTSYNCDLGDGTIERELSFHVDLGPGTERRGDVFPVFEIPEGRMLLVSDWSFNASEPLSKNLIIGGSIGRISGNSVYTFSLNCGVFAGEMAIYSPARPIRFLAGEWLAVCFHQKGDPFDLKARATFRATETSMPAIPPRTTTDHYWAPGSMTGAH